jgi:hypothetical protein
MRDGWARLGAVLVRRFGEAGKFLQGCCGGARDGPEGPPIVGMPRACSVRRRLGGAAAHLLSAVVSVGGSRVEELSHHCWSEAARGLAALLEGHLATPIGAKSEQCMDVLVVQLRARCVAPHSYIS